MQDNHNNQFEELKNNGETEQVPKDIFGFSEASENSHNKTDKAEKKISFAALRQKQKVPRLRKSMVLALITGGVFIFLLVVNLFLQKKEEQKKYFEDQNNNIAVGNEFSLGELEKKVRQRNYEKIETVENDGYLFIPPSYPPLPAEKTVSTPPAGGNHRPGTGSPGSNYSDSDLLAIKAQIGKEGGYGPEARTVAYNNSIPAAANPAMYYPQPVMPGMMEPAPSREEYTRQRIDDIAKLTQATANGSNTSDNTRYSDAGRYNPHNPPQGANVSYVHDDCLFPGTIIHAILISRIDTDYPGPIHARVTENVYDSMTGKNLLIPQGTILQGNYSSSSIGVSKVQIAWESMVVNYSGIGYQVSLGGMAGVDKRGRAGIAGTLDDHYFEWLKAAGIISLFTMLNSEIAYQTQGQTSPQVRELMELNQGIVNQFGDKLIERALNIQPTVRVANGTAVSVSVNTILNLRPFPAIKAEEKWVRK